MLGQVLLACALHALATPAEALNVSLELQHDVGNGLEKAGEISTTLEDSQVHTEFTLDCMLALHTRLACAGLHCP